MDSYDSDPIQIVPEGNHIRGYANKELKDRLIHEEPDLEDSYSARPKTSPSRGTVSRDHLERVKKILKKTDGPFSNSNSSNYLRSKPSAKSGNLIKPPTNEEPSHFKNISSKFCNRVPLGVQHSIRQCSRTPRTPRTPRSRNQTSDQEDPSLGQVESVFPLDGSKLSFKTSNPRTDPASYYHQLNDPDSKKHFGIDAYPSTKHHRTTPMSSTGADVIDITDGPLIEETSSPLKKINSMKDKSGQNKQPSKLPNSASSRNTRVDNRISPFKPRNKPRISYNNNVECDPKSSSTKSIWRLKNFVHKSFSYSFGTSSLSDLYLEIATSPGTSRLKISHAEGTTNPSGSTTSQNQLGTYLAFKCGDMKKHYFDVFLNHSFVLKTNEEEPEVFSMQAESRSDFDEIIECLKCSFPETIIKHEHIDSNEFEPKLSSVRKTSINSVKRRRNSPEFTDKTDNLIQADSPSPNPASSPVIDFYSDSFQRSVTGNEPNQMVEENQPDPLNCDVMILHSSPEPVSTILEPTVTNQTRKRAFTNSPTSPNFRFPKFNSSNNHRSGLDDASSLDLPDVTDLFKVDDKKELASPYRLRSRQRKLKSDTNVSDNGLDFVTDNKPNDDHQNLLFIFPYTGKEGVSVFQKDLVRLGPRQFLNDSIIEFYLKYILDKVPLDQKVHIQLLSSFLYNVLEKNRDNPDVAFEKVKSWTRKINLLSKRYIIIPINEQVHWYLVIIGRLDRLIDYCEYYKSNSVDSKVPPEVPEASSHLNPPFYDVVDTNQNPEVNDTCNIELACGQDSSDKKDSPLQNNHAQLTASESIEQATIQSEEHAPILISDSEEQCITHDGEERYNDYEAEDLPQPPWIAVLDSLGKQSLNVIEIIRNYIVRYVCETSNIDPNDINPWLFKNPIYVTVPRQKNCFDCGVYLLDFSEYFFNNLEESENLILRESNNFNDKKVNIKEANQISSSNNRFPWRVANSIKEKRREIEKLIRQMSEEYPNFIQGIFKESPKFEHMESDVEVLE